MVLHDPTIPEGATLKCWANRGLGPMSTGKKIVFLGGLAVVLGSPLVFFFLSGLWFLLGLYVLLIAGFFWTLKMFLTWTSDQDGTPRAQKPDQPDEHRGRPGGSRGIHVFIC